MVNLQSRVRVFDYVPRPLFVYHEVTTLQRSLPLWMFRKHCKQWLNDVATLKHLLNRKIECFRGRHSRPIFKFWKNGLFICSIDRVLIVDLRNIVCWVGISYFGMHSA